VKSSTTAAAAGAAARCGRQQYSAHRCSSGRHALGLGLGLCGGRHGAGEQANQPAGARWAAGNSTQQIATKAQYSCHLTRCKGTQYPQHGSEVPVDVLDGRIVRCGPSFATKCDCNFHSFQRCLGA
jgi:hypothetical protein